MGGNRIRSEAFSIFRYMILPRLRVCVRLGENIVDPKSKQRAPTTLSSSVNVGGGGGDDPL